MEVMGNDVRMSRPGGLGLRTGWGLGVGGVAAGGRPCVFIEASYSLLMNSAAAKSRRAPSASFSTTNRIDLSATRYVSPESQLWWN